MLSRRVSASKDGLDVATDEFCTILTPPGMSMMLAFVVFLSAFLLFQVQLIAAKHLLPWFGGTPAVWTTSQMFFQLLLLGIHLRAPADQHSG